MLWTIGMILLILWLLGFLGGYRAVDSFISCWSSPSSRY